MAPECRGFGLLDVNVRIRSLSGPWRVFNCERDSLSLGLSMGPIWNYFHNSFWGFVNCVDGWC